MVKTDEIKARLKGKRMTQTEAAKKLGMDPSTFNRKINNEDGNCISVKEANDLSALLDIPSSEKTTIFFAD